MTRHQLYILFCLLLLCTCVKGDRFIGSQTVTDGVLSVRAGSLTSSLFLQTNTLTDSTLSITSGSITNAHLLKSSTFTDGTASLTSASLTSTRLVTSSLVTDGTMSMSGGSLTSVALLAGGSLSSPFSQLCTGTLRLPETGAVAQVLFIISADACQIQTFGGGNICYMQGVGSGTTAGTSLAVVMYTGGTWVCLSGMTLVG